VKKNSAAKVRVSGYIRKSVRDRFERTIKRRGINPYGAYSIVIEGALREFCTRVAGANGK
jgi:hypothetical protein